MRILSPAALVAAFLTSFGPFASALAAPLSILYHETLNVPAPTGVSKPLGFAQPQAASLAFDAFGKRFALTLERNERVAGADTSEDRGVEVYRGELTGRQGTWARLSRRGGQWTGAIFDGTELYFIDRRDSVEALLALPRANDGGTIVYRWSDTTGDLVDELMADSPDAAVAASASASAPPNAAALLGTFVAEAQLNPARELKVGFIADYEYSRWSRGQAAKNMLEIVNVLDGLFGRQLGLFIAPQMSEFTTDDDPFTTDMPDDLLKQLGEHKYSTLSLRTLGLAHLFTGRDLQDRSTSAATVGMAYMGTVCAERNGVGLTQATFGTGVSALIAAHEIGHNLGAPHDAEVGSKCAASPSTFLMNPMLNSNPQLSQCSLDEIERVLASKTCFGGISGGGDLAISINPVTAPVIGFDFVAEVVATVAADGQQARNVVLDWNVSGARVRSAELSAEGSCESGWTRCSYASLAPGRSQRILLHLTAEQPTVALHVEAVSINDPNAANNVADHVFSAAPASDLRVALNPTAVYAHPGEEVQFAVIVASQRYGDAAGAKVRLAFGSNHDVLSVSPNQGSCAIVHAYSAECDLGGIPLNQSREIIVRLRMRTNIRASGDALWQRDTVAVEAMQYGTAEVDRSDNTAKLIAVVAERLVDLETEIKGERVLEAGETGHYGVTVRNNGPELATDVRLLLREYLEAQTSILGDFTSLASCTRESRGIACTVPTLAPGESFAVTVDVRPPVARSYQLTATTSQREFDYIESSGGGSFAFTVAEAPSAPAPPSPTPPASEEPAPPAMPSGGGGGAVGLELLLLLAAVARRGAFARVTAAA